MLAEAVWQTGTTGRYPTFEKASAHSTEVRLGILANASASAMAPSGPPLPMKLLARLCDVQEWAVVRTMPKAQQRELCWRAASTREHQQTPRDWAAAHPRERSTVFVFRPAASSSSPA